MATIVNCLLRIAPDPLDNQATIIATCDIEFTDFEMRAMSLLELHYAIDCRVLNKDLWYEAVVVDYDRQILPSADRGAQREDHVVFETVARMSNLHEHVVTRDQLVAEFTVTDLETDAQEVKRSAVVTADLV